MADLPNQYRPFSIRLYLPEGTPSGLTIATIPNWAGSVMRCRNASLPALLDRPESGRPGVYILQGPDPAAQHDSEPDLTYVGQAGRIRDRLPQSARERDFWEAALVVTTGDTNFSSAHFLALEAVMIETARRAGRLKVVNSASPREDSGGLGEADRAEIDTFLSQVQQVLPVLGFDLLRPRPIPTVIHPRSGSVVSSVQPAVRFQIRRKEGLVATAQEIDGDFVVLEGSRALASPGFVSNGYAARRQSLKDEGVLIADNDPAFLRFVQSVPFSSPSAAASVVLDRSSNGRTEWRVEGGDLTYEAWQSLQAGTLKGDITKG